MTLIKGKKYNYLYLCKTFMGQKKCCITSMVMYLGEF